MRQLATELRGRVQRQLEPLPADRWEFCRRCVWTYDERAHELGLDPKRRFPLWPHLELLTREWERHDFLRVEKAVQIGVTWWLAAMIAHEVLVQRGRRVAWMCKKFEDAADHIRARVWHIYENIPAHFQKPQAQLNGGDLLVFHEPGSIIPSSRVEAMAEGAHQLRSFTYSVVVGDEAGFQEYQEEVHAAAMARAARVLYVSSANGENFQWLLGNGSLDTLQPVALERKEVARGTWVWDHNGFRHVRLLHYAHPDHDPETEAGRAWYARTRPLYSERKWRREQLVDHSVPAGLPVYGETDKIREDPKLAWNPKLPLVVWWDFGWTCHTAGFGQVVELGSDRWEFRVLAEVYRRGTPLSRVADEVLEKLETLFPSADVVHFGDPSGRGRNFEGQSAFDVLRGKGIPVRFVESELVAGLEMCQWIISAGWLVFAKDCAPMLFKALRGGYGRDDHGQPVKDGVYDHPADAWRYAVVNLFRFESAAGGRVLRPSAQWRGSVRRSGPAGRGR